MNTSELVTAQHLTREAIVYIRQSTPHQAISNQESLELQYALKQRALDLGWRAGNIKVIDADLGLTGASAEKRGGFKELLTKVALGQVGIILSYDVTRLSRNCSDWYPLLDICGYRQCLIADRDGVYDAGTTNGRLLLGLKGQLAEMELSTIKARLNAGLFNKAQRGDLAVHLPTGLIRTHGCVYKDPNLEVQGRIELVFEIFLAKKTAAKVLRYFNEHKLTIPRYNGFGELQWKEPTLASITFILKTPAYAGAFTYGRTRTTRKMPSTDKTTRRVAIEEWRVLIKDKYPGYITWETFEKIQSMLKDNYAEYNRNKTRGQPRAGAALLQGIAYCGECGHKMVVEYKGGNAYLCNYLRQQRLMPICQFLPADVIDQHVIPQFFEALKPIELDAYSQSVATQKELDQKINTVHKQQLERLKYQAKLAERQFYQVDPDNRLVAAELEKRWEEALIELKQAEAVFEQQKQTTPAPQLSKELKNAFLDIGKKLPLIWDKSILSRQQKKAFIRCIIDKVVMHRIKPDCLQIRIVWQGGQTTTSQRPVTVGSFAKLSTATEMEEIIVKLSRDGKPDIEIAEYLTNHGHRSPMKQHVLTSTVRTIRLKHKIFITKHQSHPCKIEGYLTVTQIAEIIGVTKHWIYDRIHNGQIKISETANKVRGKYIFKDTVETVNMFNDLKSGKFNNLNFL